jgi:hypothetical protein
VHDHAEELLPADALTPQNADDGVIAGRFDVACFPAAGDLEEIVDEFRRRGERGGL